MNILRIIGHVLSVLAVIFAVGFVAMVIVALSYDFYLSMRYSIGTVSQDKKITFVKKIIKEEDKCVYFEDVYGRNGKICGSYGINIDK